MMWPGVTGDRIYSSKHCVHTQEHINTNIFKYTQDRQLGRKTVCPQRIVAAHLSETVPGLYKEHPFSLGNINKIFTSAWLSDRQVVFGTKCNKVIVLDVHTRQMAQIPGLKSSKDSQPADCPCGIHGMSINPSRTLIATGAEHTNDLAVYRLPTFDPLCTGEQGHTDWIFDMKWLDDEFLVTGARDSKLSLWHVREPDGPHCEQPDGLLASGTYMQTHSVEKPVIIKSCKKADKIRALAYNKSDDEIAALSLNGYIHLWDTKQFMQKQNRKLSHTRENVCMAFCEKRDVYAIGSQSHVTLMDPRTMKNCHTILSKQRGCGIRSVSFNESVVTIGTGAGVVLFYELRAQRYLNCDCGHECMLKAGRGWLLHDDTYRDYFMDQDYPNAIYTHCYDNTGTRLFTAGGPLPAGLWGNYASIWQ